MKFAMLSYLDSHIACDLESRTDPKDEVCDALLPIPKMKFAMLSYLDSHIACGLESRTDPKDEVCDALLPRFAVYDWLWKYNSTFLRV